jgi:hypothetical protein
LIRRVYSRRRRSMASNQPFARAFGPQTFIRGSIPANQGKWMAIRKA